MVVSYEPAPWPRSELSALVELERTCCPFLSWDLSNGGETLTLRISPAPGAAAEVTDMLPELVSGFAGPPESA